MPSPRLIHVDDGLPGITRERVGDGWRYRDTKGKIIRERDEVHGVWAMRDAQGHALAVKLGVAATTNDGEVALDWALQGLGILQRSEWHVAPYLRSGRLQTVLPGWQMPGADIHAVLLGRKADITKASAAR